MRGDFLTIPFFQIKKNLTESDWIISPQKKKSLKLWIISPNKSNLDHFTPKTRGEHKKQFAVSPHHLGEMARRQGNCATISRLNF